MTLRDGVGAAALGLAALAWLLVVRRFLPGKLRLQQSIPSRLEARHAAFAALLFVATPSLAALLFPFPAKGAIDLAMGSRSVVASLLAAATLALALAAAGVRPRDFGFRKVRLGRTLVVGALEFLAWTPLAFVVLYVAKTLAGVPADHSFGLLLQGPAPPWAKATVVLAAVFAVPLHEELVFRGVLQTCLARRLPGWLAVGSTAVVFAAVHSVWPTQFPLFLIGAMLGLAYARTRSLWSSILAHGALNGLSVLLALFTPRG